MHHEGQFQSQPVQNQVTGAWADAKRKQIAWAWEAE